MSGVKPKSNLRTTVNYTSLDEKYQWHYLTRQSREMKDYWFVDIQAKLNLKQEFRARRSSYNPFFKNYHHITTYFRINYENSPEIGCFVKLTNSYCILPDLEQNNNFTSTLEQDFGDEIPLIKTSICGCTIIGRLCAGNKHGLLVPASICDTEFNNIKSQLPENVKINKLEEKLSALGNVIVCNDHVALIHPDLDKETEEIIANTLQVDVYRSLLANNALPGSYAVLNNYGGLVCPKASQTELENLSSLLDIPLTVGTVNGGSDILGSGMLINDNHGYAGMLTTTQEFSVIENIFKSK